MPILLSAGAINSAAQKKIRCAPPLKVVSISATTVMRTSSTPTTVTERDAVFNRAFGVQVSDYIVRVEYFGGTGTEPIIWSSSNPSIADVSSTGFVTFFTPGTATITATTSRQTINRSLNFFTAPAATIDTVVNYVSGSLAKHCSDAIDNRIQSKNPLNALNIFSVQNHNTSTYVRNPSCWASDIDLTCISPWNSSSTNIFGLTLISPRHVIGAAHAMPSIGSTVRFVTTNNTVVTRTLTNTVRHPTYQPYYPDISIGVLDSDVPNTITFCRLLPSNWKNYIPALDINRTVPALCLDQEEKALITDWYGSYVYASFSAPSLVNAPNRLAFYEQKIGGDSGNPAFLIINNQLVLLTTWTFGGAGSGTFLTPEINAINTMMTTLGGGYQVSTVNLSSYPSY